MRKKYTGFKDNLQKHSKFNGVLSSEMFLTATNVFPPLKVYSVALYPKAKAPPTVTMKLTTDQMCEFIAFTEKFTGNIWYMPSIDNKYTVINTVNLINFCA